MFGYISPIESEMGPEDRATFRAFYCGTCKQMGWPARMVLSYECAFLAAVRSSCGQAQPICTKRCPVKPYKKVEMILSEETRYAADINTLLAYYDLCDKIDDGAGRAMRILRCAFKPKVNKIRKRMPQIDSVIRHQLSQLEALQKANSEDVDAAADTFAALLQTIAAPGADRKGPLGRFFYNIGRWIYLQDAMNDFEQDIFEKQYNVLVNRYHDLADAQEAMEFSLWHTLGEADLCIEQLNPGAQSAGIIEHMLVCALPEKTQAALDRGGENAEPV